MKLSIIIVSYNTKDLLKNCLDSLQKFGIKQSEIIVVDNASSDESVAMVKKSFSKVKIITNKKNTGFAVANNQGIKSSKGDYILLLNSDTLVKKGALSNLTSYIDSHPNVGIASPKLLNADGTIQPAGGALPGLFNLITWFLFLDHLPYTSEFVDPYHQNQSQFYQKTRLTGWVPGTAMLIRSDVIKKIGVLDEKIFMYAEDIDFCLRAQKAGYDIGLVSNSEVVHLGQGSGSKEKALTGEISGLIYLDKKHKPFWQQLVLKLIIKKGALLRMLVFGTILANKPKYEIYKTNDNK